MPTIAASLFARFSSRQDDSPTMKAVAALRNQFGGHAVQAVEQAEAERPPDPRPVPPRRRAAGAEVYVRHLQLGSLPQLGAGRPRRCAPGRPSSSGATERARPTWSRRSATWPRWAATGWPPTRRWSATATRRPSSGRRCAREDRELLVEIEINPGRANRVRVNRAPLPRPRELLGLLRTVLFAPEDLALVRGDPTERRRFLDELLVTRTPRLAGVRADYDRVLKQRNALLKSGAAGARQGDRDARRLGRAPHRPRRPAPGGPAGAGRRPAAAPGRSLRRGGRRRRVHGRPGLLLDRARCRRTARRSPPTGAAPVGRRADRRHGRAGRRAAGRRAGPRHHPGRAAPRRPGAVLGPAPAKGFAQPRGVLVAGARRCGSARSRS